jgi:hypothetical protein
MPSVERLERHPAADEMDNLQAVAVAKQGLRPLRSRNDLQIQFDGNTIRFRAELRDQCGQRQAILEYFGFAVDLQGHWKILQKATASFRRVR